MSTCLKKECCGAKTGMRASAQCVNALNNMRAVRCLSTQRSRVLTSHTKCKSCKKNTNVMKHTFASERVTHSQMKLQRDTSFTQRVPKTPKENTSQNPHQVPRVRAQRAARVPVVIEWEPHPSQRLVLSEVCSKRVRVSQRSARQTAVFISVSWLMICTVLDVLRVLLAVLVSLGGAIMIPS